MICSLEVNMWTGVGLVVCVRLELLGNCIFFSFMIASACLCSLSLLNASEGFLL